MEAKTPRPAGIHRSSPADVTRGAPRHLADAVDVAAVDDPGLARDEPRLVGHEVGQRPSQILEPPGQTALMLEWLLICSREGFLGGARHRQRQVRAAHQGRFAQATVCG